MELLGKAAVCLTQVCSSPFCAASLPRSSGGGLLGKAAVGVTSCISVLLLCKNKPCLQKRSGVCHLL